MGLCLNRVPSTFTKPHDIVLEQLRAKNGSLFRVKKVFFAREKHIKLKSTNKPHDIVLEQLRAKNGSLFRVKKVFFAREKHIKLKSTNKIQH